MAKVQILDHDAVMSKITRMAYELWERNIHEKELLILGIEKGGMQLAKLLKEQLSQISDITLRLEGITMDKKDLTKPILISNEEELNFRNVVLVDDVANTGKTLMFAITPILKYHPNKLELVVLVNRKHKNFPIKPDIIGTEIATTLQENIDVVFNDSKKISVFMT